MIRKYVYICMYVCIPPPIGMSQAGVPFFFTIIVIFSKTKETSFPHKEARQTLRAPGPSPSFHFRHALVDRMEFSTGHSPVRSPDRCVPAPLRLVKKSVCDNGLHCWLCPLLDPLSHYSFVDHRLLYTAQCINNQFSSIEKQAHLGSCARRISCRF